MHEIKTKHSRASVNKWTQLLSVATRLAFYKLRQRAISELWKMRGQIHPIERVVLAQRFDIQAWLKPSFEEICTRDAALEVHEAEKIGLATAILLAKAREEVLKLPPERVQGPFDSRPSSPFPPTAARSQQISRIVEKVFWPPATVRSRTIIPENRVLLTENGIVYSLILRAILWENLKHEEEMCTHTFAMFLYVTMVLSPMHVFSRHSTRLKSQMCTLK